MLEESNRPSAAADACANDVTNRAYFSYPLWYMRGDTDEPHRVGDNAYGKQYERILINEWTNTIYAVEFLFNPPHLDIYDGKGEAYVRIPLGLDSINDVCIDETRHRAYILGSRSTPEYLGTPYLVAVVPIDPDGDGLVRGDEDIDDDGVLDPGESDPAVYDTDGDGINDGYERGRMTDPSNPDTDGDGLTDFEEDPNINLILDPGETDPLDPDCDDDGVADGNDEWPWNAQASSDSDHDGLPDEWEMAYFGSLEQGPHDDYDGDGCDNIREWQYGTDPTDSASYVPTLLVTGAICLIVALVVIVGRRRGKTVGVG
jgi:hypothetical protein